MDDNEYSKREIDVFLSDLRQSLSRNEGDLNTIKIQTMKTNGTVADLKEKQIRADERYTITVRFATGALVVIASVFGWALVQLYILNGVVSGFHATVQTITTELQNHS